MIVLEKVHYSYGTAPALSDINLQINTGESVALIGQNGSGKSTLMKIIVGLVSPSAGTYKFQENLVDRAYLSKRTTSKDLHRKIGFLFQNSDAQLFCPTVTEEIAFGPLQLGLTETEIQQRVNDCANLLGITSLLPKASYQLSEGEKRKVALGSVLSLNPEVLVLDEPLNSLDPKTKRFLNDLLKELKAAGKTIIASTHDFTYLTGLFDKAVVLSSEHRIARIGSYSEIIRDEFFLTEQNII